MVTQIDGINQRFPPSRKALEDRIDGITGALNFRSGSPANFARLKTKFPKFRAEISAMQGILNAPNFELAWYNHFIPQTADLIRRGAPLQDVFDMLVQKRDQIRASTQVTTSTSEFLLGSTTGAVSFTPPVEVTSSVVNPQSRSIIRIDTSQSGLANNVAKITINVLVRDPQFIGKTITTNVIDSNTGLRFGGSTSNFILRDREQKVSNIVWIESRERISGQVILSLQGEDFSRGANFEFQSTTIPDLPCPTGFHRDPITQLCTQDDTNGNGDDDDMKIDTGRNLFQSAIIGVLALGAIGGSLLDDKPKRRKR